jgi:hypothetical protein
MDKRRKSGAVLVALGAGLTTFILFVALVVDVGVWYTRKAATQACADMAALTALGSVDTRLNLAAQRRYVKEAALRIAASNGYDAAGWSVATLANAEAPANTYVARATVVTTQVLPTFFWRVVSAANPSMRVSSIAEAIKKRPELPPCSYLATTSANFKAGKDRVFDSWDSRVADYDPVNLRAGVPYDGQQNVGCTNYENRLQNHDFHFGNLYSAGTVTAHGGSWISGDVVAARTVTLSGAAAGGKVLEGQDVPRWLMDPVVPPPGIDKFNDNNKIRVCEKKNPTKCHPFKDGDVLVDTSKTAKWSSVRLEAGETYYFTKVQLDGVPVIVEGDPAKDGQTRIYLEGDTFELDSIQFQISQGQPGAKLGGIKGRDLAIFGLSKGRFELAAGAKNVADVYLPDMSFDMGGGAHLFGRVWARSIDFKGAASFTYDKALDPAVRPDDYYLRPHLID